MGVATEDDGNTDVEDFLDVVFRQLWEGDEDGNEDDGDEQGQQA